MWLFKNTEVNNISDIPEGVVGFVYLISNEKTGEWYVGKKSLYSTRSLPPLKGYKRKRKVTKQSNWLTYQSSSQTVKEWFSPKKYILKYCYSQKEMTYQEIKALMCSDALEDSKCLNENISGKFFKGEFSFGK